MLYTYTDLKRLVECRAIYGKGPAPYDEIPAANINGASIDVRLGTVFYQEDSGGRLVHLARREGPNMRRIEIDYREQLVISPGEFIIGGTVEFFNLPRDTAALFVLKSSLVRAGLEHAQGGWCDPGWNGSVLTLELKNNLQYHPLVLSPGMKIGQMIFFQGAEVPYNASYAARGQYNNDSESTLSRGSQ